MITRQSPHPTSHSSDHELPCLKVSLAPEIRLQCHSLVWTTEKRLFLIKLHAPYYFCVAVVQIGERIVASSIYIQSVSAIVRVFDSCKSITISGAALQAIRTIYTHVHGHHVHQNDQCAAGSHLTYTVHDT